jgi:hypothetical protein
MPEPVNRTILLLDIEQFSPRDDVVQAALRRTLNSVLDATLTEAGAERTQQYREDRGDGLIVLLSGDVAKTSVLRALLTVTPELLHSHNRLAARSAQMRVRVVLSAGEIAFDPQENTTGGVVGRDLNEACRLLDSDELRQALIERADEPITLCVSDSVYQGVVRHGHTGIRADLFQRREVEVKAGRMSAWFYGLPAPQGHASGVPGREHPRGGGSPQPAAAAVPPPGSAGPASGAMFHFHGTPTVHGPVVGGDLHGVSGGTVSGDVVIGGTKITALGKGGEPADEYRDGE